jgi:hypothetical protein
MQAISPLASLCSAARLLLVGPNSADRSLEERRIERLAIAFFSTCYFEAAERLGADLIDDGSDRGGAKF